MNDEWTITHCSIVRSLDELSDTAFDELKEAIEKEEARRDTTRFNRAQELQKQIIKSMQQIENEGFCAMHKSDKLNSSNIWVQY